MTGSQPGDHAIHEARVGNSGSPPGFPHLGGVLVLQRRVEGAQPRILTNAGIGHFAAPALSRLPGSCPNDWSCWHVVERQLPNTWTEESTGP